MAILHIHFENLLIVHRDIFNFINIFNHHLGYRKFSKFTVYKTAYTLFIFSKILKIESQLNMIIEIEIETYSDVRDFDVLNFDFNYGH